MNDVYNIVLFGIINSLIYEIIELFITFRNTSGNKKYSLMNELKTENQFDTLRIKIPSSTFRNLDFSKFHKQIKVNADTGEIDTGLAGENYWLNETGGGLNTFTYIPHLEMIDCSISAKILREDYYKGIQISTMEKVFYNILERGICEELDPSQFIEKGQVLRADNTFNIKVSGDTADYYDALELVASKGRLGKIQTYAEETVCTGVVLGKNTKKLQKITIYNKLEEAKAVSYSSKYLGMPFAQMVEKEYGMKHKDFVDFFSERLRVELRVSDFDKLRKFYTSKRKGDVFLDDLLTSRNNAILYQYNQMVSEKDSRTAIDFLNMMLEDKINYKTDSFSSAANWALLKEFVHHFRGDEQKVIEKVRKLYYKNDDGTLKKISPSVKDDIIRFCSEYRQNVKKAKKGDLFSSNLTEKYKEIENQIKNL